MRRYKHVFFDLDQTLWDFDKSSAETLRELYSDYTLQSKLSCNVELIIERFSSINERLWDEYSAGRITKEELRYKRFREVFHGFGEFEEGFFEQLGEEYLIRCPQKGNLLPFAKEVLDYLISRYQLHIITNGFEEIQHKKIYHSGIQKYFKEIVTSDKTGCRKPEKKMFTFALEKVNCSPHQCIMIGDNLQADMLGASNSQIDQVFYNPKRARYFMNVTYEINCLSQLMDIL
jgi:putative hydrolase of the HAD superfamily